jgi:hypothetical protein
MALLAGVVATGGLGDEAVLVGRLRGGLLFALWRALPFMTDVCHSSSRSARS